MKKIYLVFAFFCLPVWHTMACDICGGAIQVDGINGVLPHYTRSQFGLRAERQRMVHPNTSLNYNGASQVMSDELNRLSLNGRWYPGKRWQITAQVPFIFNTRRESLRRTRINGVGDISLIGSYMLYNTNDSAFYRTRLIWLSGTGCVLPNGKYQRRDETRLMLPPGMQPGTGAYQLLFNNQLTLRRGNWAAGNYTTLSIPGTNELDYRQGMSLSNSTLLFYQVKRSAFSIMPQAGLLIVSRASDRADGRLKSNTAIRSIKAQAGLNLYMKQYALQLVWDSPLNQQLDQAQPAQKGRFSLGLFYFIAP